MLFNLKAKLSSVAIAVVMATGAQAGTVAFDVSGGVFGTTGDATLGYEFSVNSTVSITELGYFDFQSDGFAASHTVGIWDAMGALLASTTLASGMSGTLIDGFRYQSLTSALTLGVGTYRIGGTNGGMADVYSQFRNVTNNTPFLTHGQSYVGWGAGLSRPTTTYDDAGAYFGPNMIVSPAAVPVPAALPLLLAGIAGLGLMGRRRKQRMV